MLERAPSVFKRAPSVFKRAPSVFKRAPPVYPNPFCIYPLCRYPPCARATRRRGRPRSRPRRPTACHPPGRPRPLGRRSPPGSWSTYPTPQPPPLKGRGRRGGLRTIERSTTTSKRARPPHNTPPTQTRRPPTRKGLGRKARPRACPYVTADPGRGACFSLLAPRKLTYRFGSAGSWPSSSFRGGSSGTLRVPSSPPLCSRRLENTPAGLL